MAPVFGVRACVLAWLVGCSGRGAQPTLLLQLSLIAHGRDQADIRERHDELVLSAEIALPLERQAAADARAPPLRAAGGPSIPAAEPETFPLVSDCEPGSDPLCAWAELAEHLAFEHALPSLEPSR
ncbi:MAG TPA: hypothetical protein VJV78_01585 [Polyangiales bacterium]|nr:hypothetical protein [Polyangiales bacterium]